jgi:hypothetical protein
MHVSPELLQEAALQMDMMRRAAFALALFAAPLLVGGAPTGTLTTRPSGSSANISRPRSTGGLPNPRATEPPAQPADNITIVSVLPAALQSGVAQTVVVRIRYTLVSVPRGVVNLGFNTGSADSFRLLRERWIERGTAEIEFSAEVVPARWRDRPFKAFVNLTTEGNPRKRSSLVSDIVPLKLN